jgi:hypothetical protein
MGNKRRHLSIDRGTVHRKGGIAGSAVVVRARYTSVRSRYLWLLRYRVSGGAVLLGGLKRARVGYVS